MSKRSNPTPADSIPEWRESFPEPNTIPDGWDLSGSKEDPCTVSDESTVETDTDS